MKNNLFGYAFLAAVLIVCFILLPGYVVWHGLQLKNCDFIIKLPAVTEGHGGVINVDDLKDCQAVSNSKLLEAEHNLAARAKWYSVYSEHPFYAWYKGKMLEAERTENSLLEKNPLGLEVSYTHVFHILDIDQPLQKIELKGCSQHFDPPQDGVIQIFPCAHTAK